MKAIFKKLPLALALAGLVGSPVTFASDTTIDKDVKIKEDVDFKNTIDVKIKKDLATKKEVTVKATADIRPGQAAMAVIDDKQFNFDNSVYNTGVWNDADVNYSLLYNHGNIQTNVAAGSHNQQGNKAAIAEDSAKDSKEKSLADAEVFDLQGSEGNHTSNWYTTNSASLYGSANGNRGNIQTNVAAGTGNQQKNNLALATVDHAVLAEATVAELQESDFNYTSNYWVSNYAHVSGSLNSNSGNIQTNVAAGTGNQQANSLAIATD